MTEELRIKCEKPITYCADYRTEACRHTCDYSIKMLSLERRLQERLKNDN